MALLIGCDEAGYGPNLGPLVIGLTLWEVPDNATNFDLWTAFEGIVSRSADPSNEMVHIADSKLVHSSAAGISAIERSASVLFRLAGNSCSSLFDLWDGLSDEAVRRSCGEPWFYEEDLTLPIAPHAEHAFSVVSRWSERCNEVGCNLIGIGCNIIPSRLFNRLVQQFGSKGQVLTHSTLKLLGRFWEPTSCRSLVLCDKHGGRNCYADFLTNAFPLQFPVCLEESRHRSCYRVGNGEIRFGVRSEEHLPVAAASIIAKYLREATMEAFNRYWISRKGNIRPTRGYPVDAARFLKEIAGDAELLGLSRDDYWRFK